MMIALAMANCGILDGIEQQAALDQFRSLFLCKQILARHVFHILVERSLFIEREQKAGFHEIIDCVAQPGGIGLHVSVTLLD
jgi:hypothetical protein